MRADAFTAARRVRFLDALAREGSVRAACAAAAISAESVYRLRRRDAVFAQGWAAALVLALEAAGEVLANRALYGVDEPIFYRGEQVGSRRRFDARLLLAHLARLEAAALDPHARRDAARFDELLAAVAGTHADADMYEFTDPADDAPAPVLPMTRDAFAADQAARAYSDWDDAEDDCEQVDAGMAGDGDADSVNLADAPFVRRDAAEARWDAWLDRACDRVDTLIAGEEPIEVKSLPDPPRSRGGGGRTAADGGGSPSALPSPKRDDFAVHRHCAGRGPEAIQGAARDALDCVAALAMTKCPKHTSSGLGGPPPPPAARAVPLPVNGEDWDVRTLSTVSTNAERAPVAGSPSVIRHWSAQA